MARSIHKLTDVTAKSDRLKPGRHSDGGGLYLNVSPAGTKSWLFMWVRTGKRREMGLGPYPAVTLAKARRRAAEYRSAVEEGRDPISERAKEAEPTFGKCADMLIESMEGSWRNDKHRAQWKMTLKDYCAPIRSKRVSEIGTDDVLSILKPIWTAKAETASRLRGRIERVLDFAKARGWRTGENPAVWRGHLRNILPARQKLTRGHHAAMPYNAVPAFVERLRAAEAISARALEFLILTAGRSSEVINATWDEIDPTEEIWTVPAERMKAGKEHRVPLSKAALAIVKELHKTRSSEFVFPGHKKDAPLSTGAFDQLLVRLKTADYTTHGFRSAFRDWAGDETSFPREIAEAALAHRVGDDTERAYRRSDALARRKKLMDAWASFCELRGERKIVSLKGRTRGHLRNGIYEKG